MLKYLLIFFIARYWQRLTALNNSIMSIAQYLIIVMPEFEMLLLSLEVLKRNISDVSFASSFLYHLVFRRTLCR